MHWRSAAAVSLLALFPYSVFAASIGFAPSSGVGFSTEPIFTHTTVKTYTVIVNNVYQKLTATIAFYNDGQEFARITADVLQEEARRVSVVWQPTEGTHIIGAKFVAATAIDVDGSTRQLSANELDSVSNPVSRQVFVDNDTDHDGIGDHEEMATYGTSPTNADTDGDGLTDFQEIFKYKTDPNKANTDGDNMNDGTEVKIGRNPLVPDDPTPPPPVVITAPPPVVVTQQKPQTITAPTPKSSNTPVVQTTTAQAPTKKSEPKSAATKNSKAPNTIITIDNAPHEPDIALDNADKNTATTSARTTVSSASQSPTSESSNINWVKVLIIIAGLFGVAAAASAALAYREQNKYL